MGEERARTKMHLEAEESIEFGESNRRSEEESSGETELPTVVVEDDDDDDHIAFLLYLFFFVSRYFFYNVQGCDVVFNVRDLWAYGNI